jgi:hypothetical protein
MALTKTGFPEAFEKAGGFSALQLIAEFLRERKTGRITIHFHDGRIGELDRLERVRPCGRAGVSGSPEAPR